MSKSVSARSNASKGRKIRSEGYKSLLDKHKDVERRFIELYRQGGTMKSIRLQLIKEFPKVAEAKEIPSVQQLKSYVDKNLKQTAEVSLIMPDYQEMLKEYDTIKRHFELCKEADDLLKYYKRSRASFRILNGAIRLCMDANAAFDDLLRKHGVIQQNSQVASTIINNTQVNISGESKEMMIDMQTDIKSYEQLKKSQQALIKAGKIDASNVIT